MGNLFFGFVLYSRQLSPLPGGHHLVVLPVYSDDAPPGQNHPPALAPGLSPGVHWDPMPLPSGFDIEPRRWYPLTQVICSPLWFLPLVNY